MMLDQDSYIKVVLRLLQLIFASVSLILLCLRLQAYDLVSDKPPVVLPLTAAVAGLSILDGLLGLAAIWHTLIRILACVVDAHTIALVTGAIILLAIKLRPTNKCEVTDHELLAQVDILRATKKERRLCKVEESQCGDMLALCKKSRAVLILQIAAVLAIAGALVLEILRKKRRNKASETDNEEDAIQLDDKNEGILGL